MPSATFGFLGNPESVSVQNGSYTIPAGKYAYVTYNLSATAAGSVNGTSSATNGSVGDANSISGTIRVPSGTQLNVSKTDASASGSTTNSSIESTSTSEFIINGNTAAKVVARVRVGTDGGSTPTLTITGTTEALYIVELYPA